MKNKNSLTLTKKHKNVIKENSHLSFFVSLLIFQIGSFRLQAIYHFVPFRHLIKNE